jgi:hypothetical protein
MKVTTSQFNAWNAQGASPPVNNAWKRPVSTIRFGSVSLLPLAKVLRPITEVWLCGFLTLDFAFLGTPRILSALLRGKQSYDPQKDSAIRDKTPLQRWFQGLNWSNAGEEMSREIPVGLGSSLIQSLIFTGFATSHLAGKRGLLMGQPDLKAWNERLIANFKSPEWQDFLRQQGKLLQSKNFDKATAAIMERTMRGMLDHHFTEDAKLPSEYFLSADEHLQHFLRSNNLGPSATFKEVAHQWVSKWAALNVKRSSKDIVKRSDALESAFDRLVFWYNDTVLKTPDPTALNKIKVAEGVEETSEHFIESTWKMSPYVTDVLKDTAKKLSGKPITEALVDSAGSLFKAVMFRKKILAAVTTIAAGMVIVAVSRFAQRGKSYPANRLYQLPAHNGMPGGHA